jgi:hypothetical protein
LQALLSDAEAPSGRVTLWPETIRARAAVERLLREWDTTLADTWFADNVEMDLDVSHRRSQIRNLVDTVEPLPDPTSPDELIRSDSPAHVVWGIPGVRGMLRCEIRLNPENPPRIQTLVVTVDDSSPSNAIASGNPTGGEHLAAALPSKKWFGRRHLSGICQPHRPAHNRPAGNGP